MTVPPCRRSHRHLPAGHAGDRGVLAQPKARTTTRSRCRDGTATGIRPSDPPFSPSPTGACVIPKSRMILWQRARPPTSGLRPARFAARRTRRLATKPAPRPTKRAVIPISVDFGVSLPNALKSQASALRSRPEASDCPSRNRARLHKFPACAIVPLWNLVPSRLRGRQAQARYRRLVAAARMAAARAWGPIPSGMASVNFINLFSLEPAKMNEPRASVAPRRPGLPPGRRPQSPRPGA